MAALPYMQLYVADYLSDTAHLTTLEHGAYMLLLMNYWQRGKPLKNSNERLASVARMSNECWATVQQTLGEFFNITDELWIHNRIERDLEAVNSKSSKASLAGKASGIKRASKASNKRSTNVQRTLNHTDTDTDTDTDIKTLILPSGSITPVISLDTKPLKSKTQLIKTTEEESTIQVACRAVWESYSQAYDWRYGATPVRNAKVSGQIKLFVGRIGMGEAPFVAAFFVQHNAQYYVQKMHGVGLLLADAEKLRTEWATGKSITATRSKQIDQTAANAGAVGEAMTILERMNHAKDT